MTKYLVWGTGRIAQRNLKRFQIVYSSGEAEIVGFIDSNAEKWGTTFNGYIVYSPDSISSLEYDYIDLWFKEDKAVVRDRIAKEFNVGGDTIKDAFLVLGERLLNKYKDSSDEEIKDYMKLISDSDSIEVFYYEPHHMDEMREVFFDEEKDLHYTFFEDKRMYFSRRYTGYTYVNGKRYIEHLWQEQDINSPHLYEENGVVVQSGDVLVDAGACEGNFALHHIDKVKKVYLIECEPDWIEALKATFEPYKEKVVFCDKYLSDKDLDTCITLNTLVKEPVNFLKMDIEGEEVNALRGADKVFANSVNMKCSICAYHRHGDEEKIKNILSDYGLETCTSKGYMLFIYDEEIWKNPELRRGIVRGYRRDKDE